MNNINIYNQDPLVEMSFQQGSTLFPKVSLSEIEALKKVFNIDVTYNLCPLRAILLKDQYIDPHWALVFDKELNVVLQSAYLKPESLVQEILNKRQKGVTQLSEKFVYFVGYNLGYGNYYHWCLQCLPTLILYFSLKNIYTNLKLLLPKSLPDFAFQYLQILNVDLKNEVEFIVVDERLYLAKEMIYPSLLGGEFAFEASISVLNFSKSYFENSIKKKSSLFSLNLGKKRLMYCARLDSKNRIIKNEQLLINHLKEKYHAKIYTNTGQSVKDQANSFHEADIIISPHGAGMTNILFCKKGTTIIELIPDKYTNPCFATLAVHNELKYFPCVFPTITYEGRQQDYEWEIELSSIDSVLSKLI
ncbi:hypothetical protein TH63_04825 [Rufibacter radiotolerans]|uniref:Glycosyltransferase 61 catalytic domain-containing protein n=1 Tax=Rufibacter radiotolerans TaxID=1379910 RepID=A0A0H4W3W9_9BACT|nr:glycosyltransferase family 61 protein [Rufibacter radiotolerans]AKQ45111.1 hypothetical protein TH63_04825 [Rufibacter radiotolerans]